MRTQEHKARAGARIPLQPKRGAVLVPIGAGGPSVDTVRCGAQTAAARRATLEIVVLGARQSSRADCLAHMDEALLIARAESPDLQVRIHMDTRDLVDWIDRLHGQVALMVIGSTDNATLQSPERDLDKAEQWLRSLPVSRIVVP